MGRGGESNAQSGDELVPVTLLCGFLGSGKTTLLKHTLETKHSDEEFKCAVIVNDMAELNIDKTLIDQTSLIQTDGAMVGMQNGCICCTLQDDLREQIIQLTQMQKFNYILVEASGISEPHEIAPLFELDDHEHGPDDVDHNHDHSKPQLGEVARLDTCVSLIDSADFYNNLGSMQTHPDKCDRIGDTCLSMVGTITELMMDQVEFANVIILNKIDLVNEKQQTDIMEKITGLNPKAKFLKSIHCKVKMDDILNTGLYKDKEDFSVTSTLTAEAIEEKAGRTGTAPEACTARFDIKSFVYRARKPFHPGRLNDLVLEPYFMEPYLPTEEEDEDENEEKLTKEEKKKLEEKIQTELLEEALVKQKNRKEVMGELLRSKGFAWMATSNDVMGGWQHAGNILSIVPQSPWMYSIPETWTGGPLESVVLKDIIKPDGEEWEYKDRRQDIVFIGHGMKQEAIQALLDQCLLTDEEMALGPEMWKETMEDLDMINLTLENEEEEEEEEEEKEEQEEEETPREKIMTNPIPYFKIAVQAIFKNWSALQLLVSQDAGGPQSKEKGIWMVGVTENWFYENKDIQPFELEDYLEDIVVYEFNVQIDDGSLREVARQVCEYFQICSGNDEQVIEEKLAILPHCDLSLSKSEDFDHDNRLADKVQNMEIRKKKEPEIDEDGFETVSRKGRRNFLS